MGSACISVPWFSSGCEPRYEPVRAPSWVEPVSQSVVMPLSGASMPIAAL